MEKFHQGSFWRVDLKVTYASVSNSRRQHFADAGF
jgi:hypothetical protein